MKRSFLKIVSLFLIIGLNYSGIFAVGKTAAHFNDREASPNNLFSATKLDFSLGFFMSDGFRTQTQGGWGSVAKGDNPGVYRDENFDDAFPNGLTIGNIDFDNALCISTIGNVGDYYAHFTSSKAIEKFLPAKGTPAVFSQSHTDPSDTEAGILAGQVVALTLNVDFDIYDDDFSVNEGKLVDFYANEAGSLCGEMSVGEVLKEANLILSGLPGEFDFSPSEINECVTEINEKFVDGERVKITTSESVWRDVIIEKYDGLNFKHTIEIEQVLADSDLCGAEIEQISVDPDLCAALEVDAYLNGSLAYSGTLLDLFNGPIGFLESTNSWKLYISLDENASPDLSNKNCEFKYIISGWQEDINILGGGFSDVEEIFDLVESGEWVSTSEKSLDIPDGPVLLSSDSDTSDDDDTDTDTDDMKKEDSDDSEGDDDDTKKDDDADDTQEGSDDAEDGDDTEEDDADTEDSTALQDNGASEDDGEASDGDEDDVDEGDEVEDNDDTDAKDEENDDSSEEDEDDADADDMKEEDNDDTDADDMKEEDGGDVEDEDDTEKDDDADTEGSTALQDNGASDDDGDDDTDADDMKEEDNDDVDANGFTLTHPCPSQEGNQEDGASDDDEEDDGNDNTEGSAQDDGAQDGLNKNMVDSVQASV